MVSGAALRMDQARAGLPALQLAGPQESARRVAIGLRGVKPEENRRPDDRLTATVKCPKQGPEEEGKSNGYFWSHGTPKSFTDHFSIFSVGQTPSPHFSRDSMTETNRKGPGTPFS